MPREQINYPQLLEPTEDAQASPPGAGLTWRDSALHVNWHPAEQNAGGEGHVQVALESDLSYLKMALEHPNEFENRTSMYTPVLTRTEVNKLIRVLKRARDQAYGRDE